jgi:hypothetical protein
VFGVHKGFARMTSVGHVTSTAMAARSTRGRSTSSFLSLGEGAHIRIALSGGVRHAPSPSRDSQRRSSGGLTRPLELCPSLGVCPGLSDSVQRPRRGTRSTTPPRIPPPAVRRSSAPASAASTQVPAQAGNQPAQGAEVFARSARMEAFDSSSYRLAVAELPDAAARSVLKSRRASRGRRLLSQ